MAAEVLQQSSDVADLCNTIRSQLTSTAPLTVLNTVSDNRYVPVVERSIWDLVDVAAEKLNDGTLIGDFGTYEACEQLLNTLINRACAEEVLLELIERCDSAKDDASFAAYARALQSTMLKRTLAKRKRSLEWALGALVARVRSLPLPGEYQLKVEESPLMDADIQCIRIARNCSLVCDLMEPFVDEAIRNVTLSGRHERRIVTCALLKLLGRPLACLDLETIAKQTGRHTKSGARMCAECLCSCVARLIPDTLALLNYACDENRSKKSDKYGEFTSDDIFADEENCSITALGCFYYMLLGERAVSNAWIPATYDPIYVFQCTIQLAASMLGEREQYLMRKGLLLAHAVICSADKPFVPHFALDSPAHSRFCTSLLKVIVYSDLKSYRELGVKILRTYILSWNAKGRYLLVWNMLNGDPPAAQTSNARGFIITTYKDMLNDATANNGNDNRSSEWFSGRQLRRMLDTFCSLPEGVETDLMEHGDQIMATLNMLIFLALRDKHNLTCVWDYFPAIQLTYLKPLKRAIDMSKAHYEQRMKDMKLQEDKPSEDDKVNVSVSGCPIPKMTSKEESSVLICALNSFEALEMLLARLNELIDEPPQTNH